MIKRIIIVCLSVVLVVIGLQYEPQQETQEMPKPSYFDDAQWHRIQMRGGEIDPHKLQAARNVVVQKTDKFLKSENRKDAGLRSWSTIGPCNISGRVRAIALQPTPQGGEIIYAGAASGGLWRSTDVGASYTVIDDIDLSLAITSISVDPLDPDVIYVATGEGYIKNTTGLPGVGIFKSSDGGDSFQLLQSTANEDFYWVNRVVADPHVAKHVYAIVLDYNRDGNVVSGQPFNGGGILKESFDGGLTWIDAFTSTTVLTDIDIHPTNPNIQVVSGHRTVRKKNGKNWDEQVGIGASNIDTFPGRIEVAINAMDDQVMYALQNQKDELGTARVYRSDDGGFNWSLQGTNTEIFSKSFFGDYANTIWVDPNDLNSNTIYLGGVDMWRSTDGGVSFTKISTWQDHRLFINGNVEQDIQLHADQHIIVPSLSYSKDKPKVYIGNDGGVQKADDIGVTRDMFGPGSGWDNLTGNMCTVQFYNGAVSSGGQFAGGTQDNGILLKDNNNYGVANDWTHPISGDGAEVYFQTEDIIFAVSNFGSLRKSIDGGATFALVADIEPFDDPFLITPTAYDKNNHPDIILLGGERLWRYDDSNGSLSLIKDSLSVARRISAVSLEDNIVLLGYQNGVVEYSPNGGASWSGDITFVGQGSPPNVAITDIHLVSANSSALKAYVTFGGYRDDHIFELNVNLSTGVFEWDDLSLGFDMQVNTVTTHPFNKDWLYVGTDVGIFASEDGGQNWSVTPLLENSNPLYNNDSPFYVEVQELFWDFENVTGAYHLCAATYGRGIIRSDYALARGAYIDRTFGGNEVGTEARPFKTFLNALGVAENVGTPVIFLEGGDYDEFSSNKILNERALIISEAKQSVIIK